MPDEQQQQHEEWERQPGEPAIWYRRFQRYLLLFPRRSVAAVYHEEHSELGEASNDVERRQKVPGLWYEIANRWRWEERAQAYDDAQFAEEEKEAQRVRRSGLALQHKRILALQTLVEGLIKETGEKDRVWLPDVKAIGTGPDAERVDLVQFNDGLYKEIREYITDIADEMGDRVKKKEVMHKGLSKMYVDLDENEDGCEP